MIEPGDLDALTGTNTLAVPAGWRHTVTGEPMPDVVAAVRRSRAAH